MTSVRIDLDKSGIRSLLASSDVQRDLDARAARVAQVASSRGIRVSGDPGDSELPIKTVSAGNAKRARALVVADHEAALAVEAKHRLLVSSLDAAR